MITFKMDDQIILLPTIGFVKDGNGIYLNLSWLIWGVNFLIAAIDEYPDTGDEN